MNRRQYQAAVTQAQSRAVALGESGEPDAIPELVNLCTYPAATVRRAAASALGKLSVHSEVRQAIPALCRLAGDEHAQVCQYALSALGKIGDATALPAIRDIANRSAGPEYVLKAALRAIELIETATRLADQSSVVACSRCRRETTPEEREISQRQFQKVYCANCFEQVFIERRNFDMKVQNHKTIMAADRTVVQSQGERRIADWLTSHHLEYRYDDKFQIIQGYAVRPDFYLPRYDVYIEYWGLDTIDYQIGMLLKKKLYQQEGKKLISVYPEDLPGLDQKLSQALSPFASPVNK